MKVDTIEKVSKVDTREASFQFGWVKLCSVSTCESASGGFFLLILGRRCRKHRTKKNMWTDERGRKTLLATKILCYFFWRLKTKTFENEFT